MSQAANAFLAKEAKSSRNQPQGMPENLNMEVLIHTILPLLHMILLLSTNSVFCLCNFNEILTFVYLNDEKETSPRLKPQNQTESGSYHQAFPVCIM